jgi:hypothetical protein
MNENEKEKHPLFIQLSKFMPEMENADLTFIFDDLEPFNLNKEQVKGLCKEVAAKNLKYKPKYRDFLPLIENIRNKRRSSSYVKTEFFGLTCPSGSFYDTLSSLYQRAKYADIVANIAGYEWGSQWPIASDLIERFSREEKEKQERAERYCAKNSKEQIVKKFMSLRK